MGTRSSASPPRASTRPPNTFEDVCVHPRVLFPAHPRLPWFNDDDNRLLQTMCTPSARLFIDPLARLCPKPPSLLLFRILRKHN